MRAIDLVSQAGVTAIALENERAVALDGAVRHAERDRVC